MTFGDRHHSFQHRLIYYFRYTIPRPNKKTKSLFYLYAEIESQKSKCQSVLGYYCRLSEVHD